MGLTLAFLFGALREAFADPTIKELRELLSLMMVPRSESSAVRIYECRTLLQPTVYLCDINSGSLGDAVVSTRDGAPSTLYAWPQYFSVAERTVDSLTRGLWELLEENLKKGQFSYRSGSYQEFDRRDKDFIKRAFAREDDDEN